MSNTELRRRNHMVLITEAGERSRGPGFLETPSHHSRPAAIGLQQQKGRCPWRQSQASQRH